LPKLLSLWGLRDGLVGPPVVAGVAVLAGVAFFACPAPAGATPYTVATEQIVLQLGQSGLKDSSSVLGGLPGTVPQVLPGERWSTDLPDAEAASIETELSGKAGVNYVSPVVPVRAADLVPNNPCYNQTCGPTKPVTVENPFAGSGATIVHPNGQTDLWAVHAAAAWAVTTGSANDLVAVLDTGVDPNQPQLKGKVVIGPDVCADDRPQCSSPYDKNGHGTFVTGIIAAATNDGIGIAGLGWNTKVIDIKVLDDTGSGNSMDEATGIYDAVSAGAKVINLSLESEPCSVDASDCGPNQDEESAVEYAIAHGVVVVAAAGNYDSPDPIYPADYPGVLSVAAGTDQGAVDPVNGGPYLDFSEYGDAANIAAPGVNVLSTWYDGNYAEESGTSMAAPHVSAAAALVMAADPSLTGPQVATLLRQTAAPLASGSAPLDGGFLDVGAAVKAAATRSLPATLDGYQLVGSNGGVFSSGVAVARGSMAGQHLVQPVVGAAERPDGLGYWLVGANGSVFAFGDAHFYGSLANMHLAHPIISMAATPDGKGYWLVGKDGGVFAFGDAHFYGSATKLVPSGPALAPVVDIASTPDGKGYWLVASSGRVVAFGDATLYGPPTAMHFAYPVTGMAVTPDGKGYWLVAKDGGVFAFGDATFYGSEAGKPLAHPVVGMAVSPFGLGYWLVEAGGQVIAFGSAPYEVASAKVSSASIVAIVS
jgi:subtilisin family serine protease